MFHMHYHSVKTEDLTQSKYKYIHIEQIINKQKYKGGLHQITINSTNGYWHHFQTA